MASVNTPATFSLTQEWELVASDGIVTNEEFKIVIEKIQMMRSGVLQRLISCMVRIVFSLAKTMTENHMGWVTAQR